MSFNFKCFIKNHWWLVLTLLLLLIVPMIIFCLVFKNSWKDVGVWAGLTSGIFTYLGASFLGVLTYYYAWFQDKQQELLERARIEVKPLADISKLYFVPFSEDTLPKNLQSDSEYFEKSTSNEKIDMNYLEFDILNNNSFVSVSASVVGLYYVNDENIVSKVSRFRVKATRDPHMLIDYKQEVAYYIGCSSEILRVDYYNSHPYSNWFVVLKLVTSKKKSEYLILDYVLGKTLGTRQTYLSEKQYNKRIKKSGTPICLNEYNEQFFKKI